MGLSISIVHNMLATNADRMLGLDKNAKSKSVEKLSSGYKINRAADDAAGLAISEKMRRLIRGLAQGTQNAQDGISWVQIGDGALEEAQDMLQRMSELSIKSMNGTNSESDRAAMNEEFAQLKSELNRVAAATKFNDINIFSDHKEKWYQVRGDVKWNAHDKHVITDGNNDISFKYYLSRNEAPREISFTVPAGEYSTLELLDEIDTAIMEKMDGYDTWFEMEFAEDGCINVNLEGGSYIDTVSGGLSYLLHEMYRGGGTGALLGTTIFPTDATTLTIIQGENDDMTFTVQDLKGNSYDKHVTIAEGDYTRGELIDLINAQLTDSTVEASAYGSGIKLGSATEFVTGFKGNMFKIDGADTTSVFYDNVKWGEVEQGPAVFQGGAVLIYDPYSTDVDHNRMVIDSSNNTLTLRPNGIENSVTVTIPDGAYDINTMRSTLDSLFNAAGLGSELNVGTWYEQVYVGKSNNTSNGYASFYGLKITTNSEGPDSFVNIDPNSSAYNTLFTDRAYTYFGGKASTVANTRWDYDASVTGGKSFSGISATNPIELTAANNSFSVSCQETGADSPVSAVITLTPGTYNSADDLLAELRSKLSVSACGGLLKAELNDGYLVLQEADGKDISGAVTVSAVSGSNGSTDADNGYRMLFVGQIHQFLPATASGSGTVSFLTPGKASGNSMNITVAGKTYTVNLTDPDSKAQIAEDINNTLKADVYETPISFTPKSDTGYTGNNHFSQTGQGRTTITPWSGSQQGKDGGTEGVAGAGEGSPAVLTVGPALKNSMTLDSTNNKIRLTVNGVTQTLALAEGNYNANSLATELQNQIDKVFGTGSGGASVSLSGGKIVLTTNRKSAAANLSCGTGDSSLLSFLNTTKSPATCTSGRALDSSIQINSGSNEFKFSYSNAQGVSADYTLQLTAGTYSRDGLITEINKQLEKTGTGVKASLSGSKLQLTSSEEGGNVRISYSTANSSAADAMFGDLTPDDAASVTLGTAIQNNIKIESGKQEFKLNINGSPVILTLDAGTYSRANFVTMLNNKLSGKGATVTLDNQNRLVFTTTDKGSGTSISVSYEGTGANSKSAMESIWGKTVVNVPSVKASWNGDSLELKADGNSSAQISVSSGTSGGLLAPNENTVTYNPTRVNGVHAGTKSAINGVSFVGNVDSADVENDKVEIDKYNNRLSFNYRKYSSSNSYSYNSVSFTLDEGTYTYEQLRDALQKKLDNSGLGAGNVGVTVSDNGVKIEAKDSGNSHKYDFYNLDGSFYHRILSASMEKKETQKVKDDRGTQDLNPAYTIGRKDVTGGVEIVGGVCDEFSFDLTVNGKTSKIEITLDPGNYSSKELVDELQKKIDEQLVKLGYQKGVVQVGVGGITSGVAGGNDNNALNFRISKEVQAPEEGEYIIDGVGGSAAFEIFYQTEGKIIPAYIMGSKDVTNGVTIHENDNDLSFEVDGDIYSISLDPGNYTAEELVQAFTDAFGDDIPLFASINNDGRLKISYTELGHHDIRSVLGGARDDVFFNEEGGTDSTYRNVQLSSEVPDYIPLPRSEFNTRMLRISNLSISSERFAKKSIDRLSDAINRVSSLRITFGSTQNRLEHAINNNRNKEENLQYAESVIRDTDMAAEMVKLSNLNILEQAGISTLTQANKNREVILGMLQ